MNFFRKRGSQGSPTASEQRELLVQKLKEIDEALQEIGIPSEAREGSAAATSEGAGKGRAPVAVKIGNSKMARESAGLVQQITTIVNTAYGCMRVDQEDVMDRLAMGDPGSSRANRVLHIAFLGERPVGCMSSTFRVPWAEAGCGHWGLLAVDADMQGKGIASAMVAAAESRLAGMSEQIQMEYEYTPGDALSERLLEWYEGRCGFRCLSGPPGRRRSEFRKCRKMISAEEQRLGQRQRLTDLRMEFAAELEALEGSGAAESTDMQTEGYCPS